MKIIQALLYSPRSKNADCSGGVAVCRNADEIPNGLSAETNNVILANKINFNSIFNSTLN